MNSPGAKFKKMLAVCLAAVLLFAVGSIAVYKQSASHSTEVLSKTGSRGEEVRQIQTKLKSKGIYSGSVDGIYGTLTLAKLAMGITDTTVTMAVKSMLRNEKPIILALATNDALRASAKNLGLLLNTKNYYFVPLRQDAPVKKPSSLVADFTQISDTVAAALGGLQIQPMFIQNL